MHIQNIYDHNSFPFTKNEIPQIVITCGELNPNSQINICPLQHKLLSTPPIPPNPTPIIPYKNPIVCNHISNFYKSILPKLQMKNLLENL